MRNKKTFIQILLFGMLIFSFLSSSIAEEILAETEQEIKEQAPKNKDEALNIVYSNINNLLPDTVLARIPDQHSQPQKSLKERFGDAKRRFQPYLNLVNEVTHLHELLKQDVFKEYKLLDLKSLYLRTDEKIVLDDDFAAKLKALIKTGLRELLIFFSKEQSPVTTEQFNAFIDKHQIDINIRMVPLSANDIAEIKKDSLGCKDMLGFIGVVDYEIIYKDGLEIPLLNNQDTDEIILHNYAKNIKESSERDSFVSVEPSYVTRSDPGSEKRPKVMDEKKSKGARHLEVSKTVNLNKEEEAELGFDLEQGEHKHRREEARTVAEDISHRLFFEENQEENVIQYVDTYNLVSAIFDSVPDMEFITEQALVTAIKNFGLFADGVDIENLPLGFAYKNNILFVSDGRPTSMPVDKFTVRLNPLRPFMSNPLKYSWLPFASKANITLNNIYGSDFVPHIYGFEVHPAVKVNNLNDILLDIPHNFYSMLAESDPVRVYLLRTAKVNHFFAASKQTVKPLYLDLDGFRGICFYDLDPSYKKRLEEITDNLKKRGLEKIFNKIVRSADIEGDSSLSTRLTDGGFLLGAEASLFFKKLFQEILPLDDQKKQKYFREILLEIINYKGKKHLYLDDVFIGLDGFYTELNDLMVKADVDGVVQEKILEKSIEIIKRQMKVGSSYKVILGRFIKLLRLVLDRGGNLLEQLEYLSSKEGKGILNKSQQYWKAKKLNLNSVHNELYLDSDYGGKHLILLPDEIIKNISDKDYLGSDYFADHESTLLDALRWLATLPSYQRASIDTYSGYVLSLSYLGRSIGRGCDHIRSHSSEKWLLGYNQDEPLKVKEYINFQEVPYYYGIEFDDSQEKFLGVDRSGTNLPTYRTQNLGNGYFLSVVEDKDIIFEVKLGDYVKKFKLSDFAGISEERITEVISDFRAEFFPVKNELYEFKKEELFAGIGRHYPEIGALIKEKIANDPSFIEKEKMDKQRRRGEVSSTIYFKFNDSDYDLYLRLPGKRNDRVKLDKKLFVLPLTLDEKVKQCKADSGCTKITLKPSEVIGTYFENFIEPFVEQDWFKRKSVEEKRDDLAAAPKESTRRQCYAAQGLITDDYNYIAGFTSSGAAENLKLLALNILSSSGEHYDRLYPDQELTSYLSLINILFKDVKIPETESINRGSGRYSIEENYNYHYSYVKNNLSLDIKPADVKAKEQKHKKIVETFVNLYKGNPIFNFAEVVALGLVDILDDSLTAELIDRFKILCEKYNSQFTQMLRVILATPVLGSNPQEFEDKELTARVKGIVSTINNLFENDLHNLVTEEGKHPENLPIFAACFSHEKEINKQNLELFITKVKALDPGLKDELLKSFANTRLPYVAGKFVASAFPVLTLADLDYPHSLKSKIAFAESNQISYEAKRRYNDAHIYAVEQTRVDFRDLKQKYNLHLSGELESQSFSDLRGAIVNAKNNDFIQVNFTSGVTDSDKLRAMNFDVAVAMFSVFSERSPGWEKAVRRSLEFLFDPKQNLDKQFLDIEIGYKLLKNLLAKCVSEKEKADILTNLLADPKIPYKLQGKILEYLNTLDAAALRSKNLTLPKLINSAGSRIMGQQFGAFKVLTDGYLKEDIGISLEQGYKYIQDLNDKKYSSTNVEKVITYCLEHKNYLIIDILLQLNSEADNINEIVSFLMQVPREDIANLHSILGDSFARILAIKDITKIKSLINIALVQKNNLSQERYKNLADEVMKRDIDYTKLITSYLLLRNANDQLDLIFNKLKKPKTAQEIFADNNLNRFSYHPERLKEKIAHILNKNTADIKGQELCPEKQEELYNLFTDVMARAYKYRKLNINEITAQAIDFKHKRMALSKKNEIEEIRGLDIEYLALTLEAMYRSTGKFPRDTPQILGLLLNIIYPNNHVIEEVATGQGKSILSALHAAYLCYIGQTVDITTATQDLARRELWEFGRFYQNLGLPVGNEIITASSEPEVYQNKGINYATASDLALFRANREFYSNTHNLALNTDVSLVSDEADFVLTSEINFKLAAPLFKSSQEEARALFGYVLDFSDTKVFSNTDISRSDDVKNLRLFLENQFRKYNTYYVYPLNLKQLIELRQQTDPAARKLYALHSILVKADKYLYQLFDQLLSAVVVAKSLVEGVDYVILKEDLDGKAEFIFATPIIKNQPSRGTVFGEGVQSFLHLLIEKNHVDDLKYRNRFDIALPSSTIFNISPKNFYDYYHITTGKIIGLTGTAGSPSEIEEFRSVNKLLTFGIPRFEEDKKIIEEIVVKDRDEQDQRLKEILRASSAKRPVIIFAESTREAERVYEMVRAFHPEKIQLCAASQQDTATADNILNNAGKAGYLTVTTPMLGRGTDFKLDPAHPDPEGFLGINLCTDITYSTKMQIYGRIARQSDPGKIISIFNQAQFGESPEKHMQEIADEEKARRMESQPLTDLLRFFNYKNQDNAYGAIVTNEFITKEWGKVIAKYSDYYTKGDVIAQDLRPKLVESLKAEYPVWSAYLGGYLESIDRGVPEKSREALCNNLILGQCFLDDGLSFASGYNATITKTPNMVQAYPVAYLGYTVKDFGDQLGKSSIEELIEEIGRKHYLPTIEIPPKGDDRYNYFYHMVSKVQQVVMLSHVFSIDGAYRVYPEYKIEVGQGESSPSGLRLFLEKDKIYLKVGYNSPIEVKPAHAYIEGIPQIIYDSILAKLKKSAANLTDAEGVAIHNYLHNLSELNGSVRVDGNGSSGNLMLHEFKTSFGAYQKFMRSTEVDKLVPLINNFKNVNEVDASKLENGKYQAIKISTGVDSSGSHAESIMTDGNLLFWANRGSEAGRITGIRVYKVIKDISLVRDAIKWLKVSHSQFDTREKIFSLLREDSDKEVPPHVMIKLPPQTVGNCGWAQTESMLKAIAIVEKLKDNNILRADLFNGATLEVIQNKIRHLEESQEWQKILKDTDDYYQDFLMYDKVKRLEALVFMIDKDFPTVFLDNDERGGINSRREFAGKPMVHDLFVRLLERLRKEHSGFINTKYEKQLRKITDRIALEVAVGSKMGESLQFVLGVKKARKMLEKYQRNKTHDFDFLEKVDRNVTASRIKSRQTENKLFYKILKDITDGDRLLSLKEVERMIKDVVNEKNNNNHLVIKHEDL